MHDHWLTIITVTKDDLGGLVRALGSAAGLRALGAQHLVIDGSSDHGVAARTAAAAVEGVTVAWREPRGIADAFNAGLAVAQGEWVWFLNGGDAAHEALDPGWLRALLRATKAAVVTGAIHFDGEDQPRALAAPAYQWPLLACWLMHPATLIRRERLLEVGGFDPRWRIAMDYDCWFRLLNTSTAIDVLSVPLARFAPGGLSEHPLSAAAKRGEEARIVWRRAGGLAWSWGWLGLRTARRLAWALWHGLRPIRRPAPPP